MRKGAGHFQIEYWAAESVQEEGSQRALMRKHIVRTMLRFGLLGAALAVVVVFSVALELIRLSMGGDVFSPWRLLGGVLPGLLGLTAVLGVSTAFVKEIYGISDWGSAFNYVWLLLFGRAPLSSLSLLPISPLPPAYPFLIVREGQIGREHAGKPWARVGGPANVVIFNDSAVILERFGRFIRVAGPGAIFLRRFERIREVLDLRPQERSDVVQALTKDGIPVQTEVQVRFQLARDPDDSFPPSPGPPRPVYRWAWHRASRCHRLLINLDEGWQREDRWDGRVMANVGSTFRALIANYGLDELLEPYDPDRDPRQDLIQEFSTRLDDAARNFGAQVLDVRMSPLKPVLEEVERERIASWRALWKAEAQKEIAKGEAAAIRERGLARAYAQMEIILTLTREFHEVLERDVVLSAEFIALRFIEALRRAWSGPGGAAISFQALNVLEQLQSLVRRDYALSSGETGKSHGRE